MRWLVIVGAGVIGIATFIFRSSDTSASSVLSKAVLHAGEAPPVVVDTASSPNRPALTAPLGAPIKPSTAIEVPKVEVVSVARESDSDESQALLREKIALLQHELSLTPSQRLHVEKALRERDSEVAAFHAEIRSSKVLLIWAHDKKAREILAASQARIAAILTPEQSRRYFEILESGRLAEGVSFEISPDLTVIR